MLAIDPIDPPEVANPVGVQDVVNVMDYKKRVFKRRKMDAETVPAQVLVDAAILEKRTLEQIGGNLVAPPWFADALAVGLAAGLAPLQNSINLLHTQLMRESNKSVMHPTDPLSPLSGVNVPSFPATLRDLRNLNNNDCIAIIEAYHIPGNFTDLNSRKEAIATFIGVIRY
eukprot:gene26136-34747_t